MIKFYSATLLKTYFDCPFSFKCKYIDKMEMDINPIYFQFGTDFHSNIKELVSEDEQIVKMVRSVSKFLIGREIVDFEKKYFKEIEGIPFYSIIDAECEDEILEFKSASNYWYQKDIDNNFIQGTLYQKMTDKKLTYLVTNKKTFKTREIPYDYDIENWDRIKKIVHDINEDKKFLRCNKYYKCYFCKNISK